MSKKLNKILATSSALLILAGVGASMNNVSVNARHRRTHRVYRHHLTWHYGTPKVLHNNSYWISNYRHNSNTRKERYVRYVTPLGSKFGVNLTPTFYNIHHHFTLGGSDESAEASIHPHYEALGHGWYRVASGAMNNSLHDELYNSGNAVGGVALIKMHGRNHLSMWYYDNNHMNRNYKHQGKQYYGYFTRHSHSFNLLKRILQW